MEIQGVSGTAKSLGFGLSEASQQSLGQEDFYKLLNAQLSNQDPLNPMEDLDFIAQMSEFTALEEMRNLNESFASHSFDQRHLSMQNLIGREVDIAIEGGQATGVVDSVLRTQNGNGEDVVALKIGNNYYDSRDVVAIRQAGTPTQAFDKGNPSSNGNATHFAPG